MVLSTLFFHFCLSSPSPFSLLLSLRLPLLFLSVSFSLSLCSALSFSLLLILLQQLPPPNCVDNNLCKIPCRKHIVLDPILQHPVCSKALVPFLGDLVTKKEVEITGWFTDLWTQFTPTLDSSEREGWNLTLQEGARLRH